MMKISCFRPLLLICFVAMSVLIVLLLHHGQLFSSIRYLETPNSTTTTTVPSWRGPASGGDLIFIGESREVLHANMTYDKADIALYKFLSRRHVACESSIRLGKALDGGWEMCIAGPFYPQQPCLVYSFGINNDFSFDDATGDTFGCTVRSFDPSMSTKKHRRNEHVRFYKIGIGGKNTVTSAGWKIRTLSTLVAQFNESNRVIDYLKMDVEYAEWSSIKAMLHVGILSRVKQLGIEVHFNADNAKTLYHRYRLLKQLEDAGFRRWYFAINLYNIKFLKTGFRSGCYEMVYINMNFLTDSDFFVAKAL